MCHLVHQGCHVLNVCIVCIWPIFDVEEVDLRVALVLPNVQTRDRTLDAVPCDCEDIESNGSVCLLEMSERCLRHWHWHRDGEHRVDIVLTFQCKDHCQSLHVRSFLVIDVKQPQVDAVLEASVVMSVDGVDHSACHCNSLQQRYVHSSWAEAHHVVQVYPKLYDVLQCVGAAVTVVVVVHLGLNRVNESAQHLPLIIVQFVTKDVVQDVVDEHYFFLHGALF